MIKAWINFTRYFLMRTKVLLSVQRFNSLGYNFVFHNRIVLGSVQRL